MDRVQRQRPSRSSLNIDTTSPYRASYQSYDTQGVDPFSNRLLKPDHRRKESFQVGKRESSGVLPLLLDLEDFASNVNSTSRMNFQFRDSVLTQSTLQSKREVRFNNVILLEAMITNPMIATCLHQ